MHSIANTLSRPFDELTVEDLIHCFELVKARGDIGFVKFDGLREQNFYTVFINFPDEASRIVRADLPTLKESMYSVLTRYVKIRTEPKDEI